MNLRLNNFIAFMHDVVNDVAGFNANTKMSSKQIMSLIHDINYILKCLQGFLSQCKLCFNKVFITDGIVLHI